MNLQIILCCFSFLLSLYVFYSLFLHRNVEMKILSVGWIFPVLFTGAYLITKGRINPAMSTPLGILVSLMLIIIVEICWIKGIIKNVTKQDYGFRIGIRLFLVLFILHKYLLEFKGVI